jgi:hypothetical protein
MSDRIVGAYTHWAKLKKVLLGVMHPVDYFDEIPDEDFRHRMKQIVEETTEDLDNLAEAMQSYGVEVHRTQDTFPTPGVYSNGVINVVNPRPPYTPRDNVDFVGNKMISLHNSNQPHEYFNDFAHHDLFVSLAKQGASWHQMPKGSGRYVRDWDHDDPAFPFESTPFWDASNLTKIGNRFYYSMGINVNQLGLGWYKDVVGDAVEFIQYTDKAKFHEHVDSRIHILRPGLYLSENPADDVVASIPELEKWDCIHLPTSNSRALKEYFGSEHHFSGTRLDQNNVADWSRKWLTDWVDNDVINTNFNINIISLDESTVILPEPNPEYQKILSTHGVDSMVCRIRHRYFWGQGLNCMTADILREDECVDYLD